MRWFEHVQPRKECSVAKTAVNLEVAGTRPRGRPELRWLECVKFDIAEVQLTTRDGDDRNRWKGKCRAADPRLNFSNLGILRRPNFFCFISLGTLDCPASDVLAQFRTFRKDEHRNVVEVLGDDGGTAKQEFYPTMINRM